MSTDLIHRLRVSAAEWLPTSDHTLRAHNLLEEAADALERLDAQLRAAQVIIAGMDQRAVAMGREYGALTQRAADVQGERDANAILTAQVERLEEEAARTARNRDMWKGQCERQAAELEALRADAERYRWLRDDLDSNWAICEWSHDDADGIGFYRDARAAHIVDAAIDAARKS